MHPLSEGRTECGICGYPANGQNAPLFLPVRTVLSDRYLVGKMLGSVGDAAIYIGYDQVLKAPIRIREFLPDTLCERARSGELEIIGGCENTFHEYFEKFRNHERALARMRELNSIITVYDIFEQNKTIYSISEFFEGNTLETRLKQLGGRMSWDEARPLFMPIMAALKTLHSAGIYHLGICPQNLLFGTDGKLRLQGFSIAEARKVSTDLRPNLIAGYSAPEQYNFGQETGEGSDVYGLAATLFRTLTGNPPPEGSKRAKDSNDLLVPANVAKELPDYVAAALFNALQVNPDNRTRNIASLRDSLSTGPAVSSILDDKEQKGGEAPVHTEETDQKGDEGKNGKKGKNKKYVALIVVIILLILALFGAILFLLNPDMFKKTGEESSIAPQASSVVSTAATTQPTTGTKQYQVTSLVGKNYYDIRDQKFNGNMPVQVQYQKSSDKEKGTVLSQTPDPNSNAAEGTTIQVVISSGPDTVTVPDLKGVDEKIAKPYLEALGLRVTEIPVVSSTYTKGLVESVDDAGKSVPVGTKINLRVSNTTLTTAAPTTAPADTGNGQ